jgi:glycerol-3-phosphate dehydrogenase subunit B
MSDAASGRIVIVGGGVAALAAAHAALGRGARVTIVHRGAGATSLFSGAIDDIDWSEREAAADLLGHAPPAGAIEAEVRAFVEAFAGWEVVAEGERLPRLVSTAGIVRTARGRDRALLDLGAVLGKTVLLPRAPRAGWDADALVRSLRAENPGVQLQVIEAPVLRYADESRVSDADLAARHDDEARIAWLAARLAPFVARVGTERAAVLFGPWLGVKQERAFALSSVLGCPAGEALHAGSGVPGLRFEVARDVWLSHARVEVIRGRVTGALRRDEGAGFRVEIDGRDAVTCDAVVVATGGLVGGGIVYDPPEHRSGPEGPERMRSPYRSAVAIEGARVAAQSAVGPASSAFGPVLEGTAWPQLGAPVTLERAGLLVVATAACAPGIFAAGDAVHAEPRTILSAIRSALRAGAGAASFALSLDPSALAAAQ